MIRYLETDGFRSLANFRFDVRPGLNVLVGPNGSGKTNIVLLFQFLSELVQSNLPNAISRLGGAGSVFRKIGEDYQKEFSLEVGGVVQEAARKYWTYRYSFCVQLSEAGERIIFKYQRLSLAHRTVALYAEVKRWDLDIERALGPLSKTTHVLHALNQKHFEGLEQMLLYRLTPERRQMPKKSKRSLEKNIVAAFDESLDPDESIIRALPLRFLARGMLRHQLIEDLTASGLINIVPSHVRLAEDSAKTPGIQQDGSGLYATLYALATPARFVGPRFPYHYQGPSETRIRRVHISEIVNLLKVANPAIDHLEIKHNSFDNQVQVRVYVEGNPDHAVLPLAAMSDGTLKWLALATAIKTSRNTLSVEEPENYLHPLMQREVLQIIRGSLSPNQFSLLTTHSETILNNADPAEVVVVHFADGETRASRPGEVDLLREEINKTGFGLGFYYLAGSLDPDPKM